MDETEGRPLTPAEVRALYVRYSPLVRRRAAVLLGSEAEADEATQEVFIRVLTKGEGFDGRSRVSTWLYRVTTNYCVTVLRTKARHGRLLAEKVAPVTATSSIESSDFALVRDLLARANEREAEAAVLVYMDGMSHREAAEVMDVSKRTVGNLLDRFRAWALDPAGTQP